MQTNMLLAEPRAERERAWSPMLLRPILDPAISDIVHSSPGTLLNLVDRYRIEARIERCSMGIGHVIIDGVV